MTEILFHDKDRIMTELKEMSHDEIMELFELMFNFWEKGIQKTDIENENVKNVYDMFLCCMMGERCTFFSPDCKC